MTQTHMQVTLTEFTEYKNIYKNISACIAMFSLTDFTVLFIWLEKKFNAKVSNQFILFQQRYMCHDIFCSNLVVTQIIYVLCS